MPLYNPTSAGTFVTAGYTPYNFLVNSGFDYLQGLLASPANGATSYWYDQWYIKNSLGTNGVLQPNNIAATLDGSGGAQQVKISTAPTAAQTNGCELYQVLSNKASLQLYNKTASFSIQIKALGNVTSVGIQFFYATSEVKLTTSVGAESTITVNTASFTLGAANAIALGTSQTTAGVVGVRIRILGVSSGNTYDLNNGFIVEQGMLNLGTVAATWSRQNQNPADELALCQYFYEKSYDPATTPANSTATGMYGFSSGKAPDAGGDNFNMFVPYKMAKRTTPTFSYYDQLGNASKMSRIDASNAQTNNVAISVSTSTASLGGHYLASVQTQNGTGLMFHWTADARI